MQASRASRLHPYHPTSIELPGYEHNKSSLSANATQFSLLWLLVLGSCWFLLIRPSHGLAFSDKLTCLWFLLCGTLHVFFEGYFILNQSSLVGKQDLFAQLWKEYSLSDSRYLTGDPLVVGAEVITVLLWGPLSYVVAICILQSSSWRHPLQAIVSLAHIYGDALYISTSLIDMFAEGISHSRPEALYFWFYFLFLNGIWLVIPSFLLYRSSSVAAEALADRRKLGQVYGGDKLAKAQ